MRERRASFDFFRAVPFERPSITRSTDAQTAVLLPVVVVAASELDVAARRRAWVLEAGEARWRSCSPRRGWWRVASVFIAEPFAVM